MSKKEEEFLRRQRELGYEPSLDGMDEEDLDYVPSWAKRQPSEPLAREYRPVDRDFAERIFRMFKRPFDRNWEMPNLDGPEYRQTTVPGTILTTFPQEDTLAPWQPGGQRSGREYFLGDGQYDPGNAPWKTVVGNWPGEGDEGYKVQPMSMSIDEPAGTSMDQKLQSKYRGPDPANTKLKDTFKVNKTFQEATNKKSTYGLVRPISTGEEAGYEGDSGLDIGAPISTPVLAAAGGKVVYAEAGHTTWQRRDPQTGELIDTPYSVLIELDTPITFNDGRQAKYIWYTHLSKLAFEKADGDEREIRVKPGQIIGHSGTANDSPHLHFGVLSDRKQNPGDYFTPAEVREMLGIKEKDKW
jgi:hypothetical protein